MLLESRVETLKIVNFNWLENNLILKILGGSRFSNKTIGTMNGNTSAKIADFSKSHYFYCADFFRVQ